MARGAHRALILLALPLSLAGCGELPIVGDLGAGLGGMLEGLRGVPVIGDLLPAPAETPAAEPPRPRVARRAAVPGAVTGVATASAEDPQVVYKRWSDRNRTFDRYRTTGLIYLYDGQTALAIENFRKAQDLRPQDRMIAKLLHLATHPVVRRRSAELGLTDSPPALPTPQDPSGLLSPGGGFPAGGLPAGGMPGGALPAGLGDALKNLQNGGGDKPDKLF